MNCNGKNQIAIDYTIEKDVEYKFNIISNNGYVKEEVIYESNPAMVYLYNQGDKYVTWRASRWSDEKVSIDIDNYDYFDIISQNDFYNFVELGTDPIDITNYNKLKMKATVLDNGYTGPLLGGIFGPRECGYIMGVDPIGTSKNMLPEIYTGHYKYSTDLKQDLGEEVILEQDISGIEGEFYVHICVTSFHLKIHQIWLE